MGVISEVNQSAVANPNEGLVERSNIHFDAHKNLRGAPKSDRERNLERANSTEDNMKYDMTHRKKEW